MSRNAKSKDNAGGQHGRVNPRLIGAILSLLVASQVAEARDRLWTHGINAGVTAAEIVTLALGNVGITWTADGCTDFVWGISNLAGLPFFDLADKTTNEDPTLPQNTTYCVPHKAGTGCTGDEKPGDGWKTVSESTSVLTLKGLLQPGDIVRVYSYDNPNETSAKINGHFGSHEFIVVANSNGNVQVVDNWSTSTYNTEERIVLHSFDLIVNAFTASGSFGSAYVSRIDPAYVQSNVPPTLRGNGYGNFLLFSLARSTGDFNHDGKSDALWRDSTGNVGYWQMPQPNFVAIAGAAPESGWRIMGRGDFNGDGTADVLWQHSSGSIGYWQMPQGPFVSIAGADPAQWQVAGVGDFNGDKYADVLWRHSSGYFGYWDVRHGIWVGVVGADPTQWQIAGVGDFNGDQRADVLWQLSSGSVGFWQMPQTSLVGVGGAAPESFWRIIDR